MFLHTRRKKILISQTHIHQHPKRLTEKLNSVSVPISDGRPEVSHLSSVRTECIRELIKILCYISLKKIKTECPRYSGHGNVCLWGPFGFGTWARGGRGPRNLLRVLEGVPVHKFVPLERIHTWGLLSIGGWGLIMSKNIIVDIKETIEHQQILGKLVSKQL